jgi:hypothetical protein
VRPLYVKGTDTNLIIVYIYVDDLLVTGSDKTPIEEFKAEMLNVLEMTDLGLMSYFLGIKVKQSNDGIFICKKKYTKEILKKLKVSSL